MTDMIPRVAVVPTHNRPKELARLLDAIAPQCDRIIVIDNASDPPVPKFQIDEWPAGRSGEPHSCWIKVVRDAEQPPNLSRLWNVGIDIAAQLCRDRRMVPAYDVAIFNDDADVPPGWWDIVSGALRAHPTAAVAHTHTYGNPGRPARFSDAAAPMDLPERMCPWAFVTRGELGLRGDERLRWWWGDSLFEIRAREAGGVLAVPGPQVANTGANTSTVGVLAEQAGRDRETFRQIVGFLPW